MSDGIRRGAVMCYSARRQPGHWQNSLFRECVMRSSLHSGVCSAEQSTFTRFRSVTSLYLRFILISDFGISCINLVADGCLIAYMLGSLSTLHPPAYVFMALSLVTVLGTE